MAKNRWTVHEIERLTRGCERYTGWDQVSRYVGRPKKACIDKAYTIGLRLAPKKIGIQLDSGDIQRFKRLASAGRDVQQIAACMALTTGEVTQLARKYKVTVQRPNKDCSMMPYVIDDSALSKVRPKTIIPDQKEKWAGAKLGKVSV